VPGAVVREVCPKPSAQMLRGVRADWLERAVALGLLECYPDGSLRVVRVLPLGLEWDEGSYRRAAEVLYRVWWEETESSTEEQRLEIWRLAIAGKSGEIACNLANKLAENWRNISRFREAINLCNKTIQLAEDCRVLNQLARCEAQVGEVEKAIHHYQRALEIAPEENSDKAAIIHNLAVIYANQGKVEEAIGLYQQSLAITDHIGDVQTKAATLHQMAIIYANQGKVEEAIGLYQQSLAIKEQIGNVQGKAATLHQMAIIYADQGKVEEAIGLYQQSLAIKEQIGNVQGKAITLGMMAQMLVQVRGDFDTAIRYFQEAIAILEKIGSPIAEQMKPDLMNIAFQKVLASPQGPQLQQALEAQDQAAIIQLIQAALEAS
jgi:tetratricopeptide (TPR) repeat protein